MSDGVATEFGEAKEYGLLRNVRVPMRDGVHLAATVYLPLAEDPCPVVLARTQ